MFKFKLLNSQPSNMSELQFEDFPNEVLLTIFSFLDIKDLIQCVKVSKRVRAICHDDSLWKKINLYFKTIPAEFINYILIYGSCKYLSLWSADLIGNMNLNQKSPLKYLDLNFCKANDGVLNNLISACDSLEKLSLRNLTLNGKMIKAIGYVKQKLTISCFLVLTTTNIFVKKHRHADCRFYFVVSYYSLPYYSINYIKP